MRYCGVIIGLLLLASAVHTSSTKLPGVSPLEGFSTFISGHNEEPKTNVELMIDVVYQALADYSQGKRDTAIKGFELAKVLLGTRKDSYTERDKESYDDAVEAIESIIADFKAGKTENGVKTITRWSTDITKLYRKH